MKATQLALTIDKVIEKNSTIQALKFEQHRQADEQHRQGGIIQLLKDVQHRQADEQHRQGVILEDIQSQIQMVAEAVSPLLSNSEATPEIKSTLKPHKQEITMTQQTLKHHIKDPNAHSILDK